MSMTGQKGHKAPASKKLEKNPKPKDSTSRKKTVVLPRFEDSICKQCKSTNMVHESIHCHPCRFAEFQPGRDVKKLKRS